MKLVNQEIGKGQNQSPDMFPWYLAAACCGDYVNWVWLLTFRGGPVLKIPPAMQEPQELLVWSLGWEDPLEKEMATHSSVLAWKIPWTEEPGGLQSMGSQRFRHDWSDGAQHMFGFKLVPGFQNAFSPHLTVWVLGSCPRLLILGFS